MFGAMTQTLCGELEKIEEDNLDNLGEAEMLFAKYKNYLYWPYRYLTYYFLSSNKKVF